VLLYNNHNSICLSQAIGFYFAFQEVDWLDVSIIKDTRTGRQARVPKVLCALYGVFIPVLCLNTGLTCKLHWHTKCRHFADWSSIQAAFLLKLSTISKIKWLIMTINSMCCIVENSFDCRGLCGLKNNVWTEVTTESIWHEIAQKVVVTKPMFGF